MGIVSRLQNINTPDYWDGVYRGEWESGQVGTPEHVRDYGPMHDVVLSLVPPQSRVLDVGCGAGVLCRKLASSVPGVAVTGVDFSEFAIESNRELDAELEIEYVCLDITASLGELEGPFDVVTMCEVLEHLDEPEQVIEEVMSLLRPGGLFIVTCPHDDQVPHPEHVREWGHDEVYHLLAPYADAVTFRSIPRPRDRWLLAHATTHAAPAPRAAALIGADALTLLRSLPLPAYKVASMRAYDTERKLEARRGLFHVFGKPLTLEPPIDWRQETHGRSFAYELHTLQALDVLLQLAAAGDRAALAEALAIVCDWVEQNPQGEPATSPFAWYDMAVGLRAPYLAYTARAAAREDLLSPPQASLLLASLVEHGAFLADDENYAHGHNHGLFQDEGLLLLAEYLPFLEEARSWIDLAARRVVTTLEQTVDRREGMHLEHSPAYHCSTTNLVRRLCDQAPSVRQRLQPLLARMIETAGWLVCPDGTYPEVGDSDPMPAPAWVRGAAEGKRGLKTFRRAGLAAYKQGGTYLLFSAGYHSAAHKHADELSFVLFADGERLVGDSGRYGYYEAEDARRHARSARAHNTLIVDDAPFEWERQQPYGSGIVASGRGAGWIAVQAVNPLVADAGVEHRRTLLLRPGLAALVVDELEAAEEHTYTRFLHLGPSIDAVIDGEVVRLAGDEVSGAITDWSAAPVERRLLRAQTEPELSGWTFPLDRKWVPVWTAEYRSRARSTEAALALALGDADVRVEGVERDADGLSVRLLVDGAPQHVIVTQAATQLRLREERTAAARRTRTRKSRPLVVTVDVEAQPARAAADHVDRLIWGRFGDRAAGLSEMIEFADRHAGKLTFFVDYCELPLYGDELRAVCAHIIDRGHELQLHAHPEFLPAAFWEARDLPPTRASLGGMSRMHADALMEFLVDAARNDGQPQPRAFRGGGFRFNGNVLDAMGMRNIPLSFNYNVARDYQRANEKNRRPFRWSNGVCEIPMSNLPFRDKVRAFEFSSSGSLDFGDLDGVYEYVDRFFAELGREAVLVMLLHSWSFLYRDDESGHFEYRSDELLQRFGAFLAGLPRDVEIVTAGEIARRIEAGDVRLAGIRDVELVGREANGAPLPVWTGPGVPR
jgi:SAM-dependent methyltransferase